MTTNDTMGAEGKVDVLAVMDRERSCGVGVDGYTEQDYQNALSARVAVAELIEAAKSLTQWSDWACHDGCCFDECKTCRLEKALARIGATP